MLELNLRINVVLVRDGDMWVAQGLEYDIAAQGTTIAETKNAFTRVLCSQVVLDLHHGDSPLAGFEPAPQEYWDRFRKAEPLATHIPEPFIPLPFMLQSLSGHCRIFA